MQRESWHSLFTFQRVQFRALLVWLAPLCIGCAAVLLAYAANHAFAFFLHMTALWWWWPFLSLPLGGMALTLFMRKSGERVEGSGIQQAIAALQVPDKPERIRFFINIRIAVIKFLAIVGGLGSGFVLGLEGPTVQIGASIFYAFRRFLPVNTKLHRRQLIMAGGAAGIAAAFNAPIAGIIFAFEEMLPVVKGNTSTKLLVAVILAGVVAAPVFGYQSYFGQLNFNGQMPLRLVPLLFLLALAGGLAGGLFSWLAVRAIHWLPFPEWRTLHPYRFVALCGVLIGVAGMAAPIFGSGAELTKEVLAGQATFSWYYLPLKMAGLLLTFLTGLPGGIFTPSLSMGAGLGYCWVPFVDAAWQTEFIAMGMVAVLSGVTRAPFASAFIMIEMTSGQNIVLHALATALVAAWVAGLFGVRFYHDMADRLLGIEHLSKSNLARATVAASDNNK